MSIIKKKSTWDPGVAPVAVIMLSLNEGHNMKAVLENIKGWAQEVFLVDSYSEDDTLDIALSYGVHVVQRPFKGFGDQWNFALQNLDVNAPWTMKLDPDERLTEELKSNLIQHFCSSDLPVSFKRQWWMMGRELSIGDDVLRVWRTGQCVFSDVSVNEHPLVEKSPTHIAGKLEHHDSPNLHHWFSKQNNYSTTEAMSAYKKSSLSVAADVFGSQLERRMWIKKNFYRIPFRYQILFMYFWLWKGLWRSGKVGYISARLWTDVFRFSEYKKIEMEIVGSHYSIPERPTLVPDLRVRQYD